MTKEAISTEHAPRALGAYSQAVQAGQLIFVSGQIPIDPETGVLVPSDDISVQTRRVMDNLTAVLRAANSDFSRVLKATIYLIDIADFAAVNSVYAQYVEGVPPARAAVQVAGLPLGARVEVELVALA